MSVGVVTGIKFYSACGYDCVSCVYNSLSHGCFVVAFCGSVCRVLGQNKPIESDDDDGIFYLECYKLLMEPSSCLLSILPNIFLHIRINRQSSVLVGTIVNRSIVMLVSIAIFI